MVKKLDELQRCSRVEELISKIFDFEVEIADIENKIFSHPTQLETIFKYVDVSFQLFSDVVDETCLKVSGRMNDLRTY